MPVIRGTCLTGFTDVMAGTGFDPGSVLRSAGVRVEDVADPEAFISYSALTTVLEQAAQITGLPDFGRRLALRQGIEILGPVGVAARTAPTTGDALRICSTYLSTYSPAITVRLVPDAIQDGILLEFRILDPGRARVDQVVELSLGVALKVLRYLRGERYRPLSVHLPHRPLTPPATYRDYFAARPVFGAAMAGLLLRASDLELKVSDDAMTHAAVTSYLRTILSSTEPGLRRPVSQLVRQLLPTGVVSAGMIARQLGLHPKTLQRRLAQEGTTFAALLESSRRDLIEHYLRDTDLPLTHVARELGYAEQSVLARSCQRWYGHSPTALRRALRAGIIPLATPAPAPG